LEVEGIVGDLNIKVQKMAKHYDRVVFDTVPLLPGIFTSPSSASVHGPADPDAK
jgi:hypothetical protein